MNLLHGNLNALAKLTESASGRYATSGVLVEADGDERYRAVATNGRYLGLVEGEPSTAIGHYPNVEAVRNAPNGATKAIIPAKDFAAATAAASKKKAAPLGRYVATVLGEKVATMVTHDGENTATTTAQTIDGRFPDWRKVLDSVDKKGAPAFSIRVDARYLVQLLTAAATFTQDNCGAVTLEFFGKDDPMRVVGASVEQKFTGLLVPLCK
jgi:hypothetical protein